MFTDVTASARITDDGKLELVEPDEFKKAMRHFKRGAVTVRVEVDRGKRTGQANRYYRLILGLISDHTGSDPADLHDYFKLRFLQPAVKTVLGKEFEVYTTTDKSPEVFHEYVEQIRRFAATELQVETPDPDPSLRGQSRHAKRGSHAA